MLVVYFWRSMLLMVTTMIDLARPSYYPRKELDTMGKKMKDAWADLL